MSAENTLQRVVALTHYAATDELDDAPRWVGISHRLFGRGHAPDRVGGGSMAFSIEAWRTAGEFPEGAEASEDRGFVLAVMRAGLRTVRAENAVVRWEPPSTWRGTASQFRRYSRSDVRLSGRGRHVLRAGAWILAPLLALRGGATARLACTIGGLAYVALPVRRARAARLPAGQWWWRIPLAIAVKDLSQISGAIAGAIDATRAARAARDAAATLAARPAPPPSRIGRARREGTRPA